MGYVYRGSPSGFDRAVAIVIASLALVLSVYALMSIRQTDRGGRTCPTPTEACDGPAGFTAAAEAVMPSLVKIENLVLTKHPTVPAFGAPGELPSSREGTGFFIDKSGLLLTNFHVVDGAEVLKVITKDRREYEAEVIGADALTDIALVRIEPDFNVVPVRLGDSDTLKVGQWVLAMGNPLGLEFFTTAGIVSGFGPPGPGYAGFYDFIQMDATINPGNSGGPLLDEYGSVVGVNTAYLGPGSGIGFAIPVNRVKNIILELKSKGRVARGFLGLVAQDVTPGLAKRFGLKGLEGALISVVQPESPAEKAGLMEGDVVVSFDGTPIPDERSFYEKINSTPPGSRVSLDVVREARHITVTATLGELKAKEILSQRVIRQCGLTLREVDEKLAGRLGLEGPGGLLVLKVVPGCPSFEAGLKFGDVILAVEGRKVNTIADFYVAYAGVKKGGQALIKIMRGGRPRLLTLERTGRGLDK